MGCRVRPLTPLLLRDACEAVHFLPFVCDCMKQQLVESSPPALNLVGLFLLLRRADPRRAGARQRVLPQVLREADLLLRVRQVADPQVAPRGRLNPRLGLLFSRAQKLLFLSLTYWRDLQARL